MNRSIHWPNNTILHKENWLYILLGVMFILYVCAEYFSPKPIDWTVTFHHKDKRPFGAFILQERLPDVFSETGFSNRTFYELQDSTSQTIVLAEYLVLDDLDLKILLSKINDGQSVLLASNNFPKNLKDTLGIGQSYDPLEQFTNPDTLDVAFGDQVFRFNESLLSSYFEELDSTWVSHAEQEKPILISRPFGKGKIVLCSNPLLFTNYALMQEYRFAELALNLLPDVPTHYTTFYQLGRQESSSAFRYVLTEAALRWGIYLSIALILLFIGINSQRRQRPIAIITPLENTTVHFIRTMAALFYRERNHKKAAEKLCSHFMRELQRRFLLKPEFKESFYTYLSKKIQSDKSQVIKVFDQIQYIQRADYISEESLTQFYQDLNKLNFKQNV
ncbi:MAG: hypothetical protein JXR03_21195 [Cyclobacteriaceae bacterium]